MILIRHRVVERLRLNPPISEHPTLKGNICEIYFDATIRGASGGTCSHPSFITSAAIKGCGGLDTAEKIQQKAENCVNTRAHIFSQTFTQETAE